MESSTIGNMNEKLERVLRYVLSYYREHEKMPTVQSIKSALQLKSKNDVFLQLQKLVQAGYLTHNDRTYTMGPKSSTVAALGTVAAGNPRDVFFMNESLSFDSLLLNDPLNQFVLLVHGDSMEDAHIFDGDYVVVHRKKEAREGDVVVASVDGELTLKRLKRDRNGEYYLSPENGRYADIHAKNELTITGVVTACVRPKVP